MKRFYLITALLCSAVVIFYRFTSIPQRLSFDELEFARLALSLEKNPVLYSPQATGHTTPYFFILLSSFKTFGVSVFALRLPAALFGIFSTALVYMLLSRFIKSTWVVFFGTFFFLTSRWMFTFARFSFEATYLLFWELFSLYFLVRFTQEKYRPIFFVLSAFGAIMAFYSYLPGRLFFIVPILYLAFKKIPWRYIVIFGALVVFAALALFAQTNLLESRVTNLTYINNPALSANQKLGEFTQNIQKILLMFTVEGDLNGRHNYPGKPALNPLSALIVLFGLYAAIKQKKHEPTFLFAMWFIVSIMPALLTVSSENPHFLRTYTLLPALSYFAAHTALSIYRIKKPLLTTMVIGLLLISALYEIRTYFVHQSRVFPEAFEYSFSELKKLKKIP